MMGHKNYKRINDDKVNFVKLLLFFYQYISFS